MLISKEDINILTEALRELILNVQSKLYPRRLLSLVLIRVRKNNVQNTTNQINSSSEIDSIRTLFINLVRSHCSITME